MCQRAELPVIDITPLRGGDPARVAAEICAACAGHGAFYIANHRVDEVVIRAASETALRFFRADPAERRSVKAHVDNRGWHALGDALMYGATRPDHQEFFQLGLDLGPDDPDVAACDPHRGPNIWSDFMPELRRDMTAFFGAEGEATTAGTQILGLIDASFDYRKSLA